MNKKIIGLIIVIVILIINSLLVFSIDWADDDYFSGGDTEITEQELRAMQVTESDYDLAKEKIVYQVIIGNENGVIWS